jgi:hypothetical protein
VNTFKDLEREYVQKVQYFLIINYIQNIMGIVGYILWFILLSWIIVAGRLRGILSVAELVIVDNVVTGLANAPQSSAPSTQSS